MYGVKIMVAQTCQGFFILTGCYSFVLFWWWWRRGGAERKLLELLPRRTEFFKRNVCAGMGSRGLGRCRWTSLFVPRSWHSSPASVSLWMIFAFKLFISCSEYQSEWSRVSLLYRLCNSFWSLFLACTVLEGYLIASMIKNKINCIYLLFWGKKCVLLVRTWT